MTTPTTLAASALLAAFTIGGTAFANTGPMAPLAPFAPVLQGAVEEPESRFDYSHIWVRWANGNGSLLDEGNGFNVEGALELNDTFHVYGDFDFIDFDDDLVEMTRWSAAVGVQSPDVGPLSAYARAGYAGREYDGFGVSSDEGLFFSTGLRFLPIDPLELEVRYSYTGSQPKYDSWRLGATLRVTDSIGLGAAYDIGDELGDDLNTLYAGVRISL